MVKMLRLKRIIGLTFALLLLGSTAAFADVPYRTFSFDETGKLFMMQDAYLPIGTIDGYTLFGDGGANERESTFSNPEDMFIDGDDFIYVADTGNGRVVVSDSWGNYVRTVGEGTLSRPSGLFVTDNKELYVADYGKQSIFVFDRDGKLKTTIGKPKSLLFGKNTPFKPKKVIVDKRGSVYMIGEGLVQGLVRLSPEGEFLGYFGGNRAGFDLTRSLQRIFYTDAQMSKLTRKLPLSPTNLAVDAEGLVYTTTVGVNDEAIKKLNVAGKNLLGNDAFMSNQIADVTVDRMGNIFTVDGVRGWIFEYNKDGNLLFIFGGTDEGNQRLGLLRTPAGIATSSDGRLFVLDGERGNIQVFKPTEFAGLVHKAISLYLDGKYVQSRQPWAEVLKLNSLFSLAHTGIGLAYYKEGQYDEAFAEFEFSGNKKEYSNAYWEIRRQWIMKHAPDIVVIAAAAVVAWVVLRWAYRRFGFGRQVVEQWKRFVRLRLVAQLLHVFRMLRHPIDGYYELEQGGKASVLSATILLVLMFGVRLFELYATSFLFSGVDPKKISVSTELLKVLIPLFAWIVSNYLVSVINDGEGRFKDIYKGTIYALSPYIMFGVPLALLSRTLTLMESVVYDYAYNFILIWCALLLFLMVKELHGYEMKETFKNIALTIVGMLIMALIAFILFGLSNQVWEFVYSLFQEVKLRAR